MAVLGLWPRGLYRGVSDLQHPRIGSLEKISLGPPQDMLNGLKLIITSLKLNVLLGISYR